MALLLDPEAPEYQLQQAQMDQIHAEFIRLLNALEGADKKSFMTDFPELVRHTEAHFSFEEEQMNKTGFSSTPEHVADHQRILGELHRFEKRVVKGSVTLARAYIAERLPDWFRQHAATMDSALAAHLNATAE